MIVVSPQWFFKGSGDQDKFYTKFSYSLYRACMQSAPALRPDQGLPAPSLLRAGHRRAEALRGEP